ncbi:Uncharacterized protein MCB1EB_1532 [Mycoavidus cysteinexigens]|uniref:Uncharacterized protein n=1 Tax=Mycoavidus cysteinexigens TaxID=1553431 RepID=A0A2Z6EW58_9BURK|nr:hypothetical protein [Mycoavidus cysteinexigens]BBE09693.1 Uncharacterized protein MCB1EB_1532 [Mycoavidus cysteinexigens]GAM51571.1 hypothetical protein EBME_0034 [bacterium endosymbiont of Mortierella elongata FMR23-6]GLR01671.1 hypothetical protein GCM10007934_14830 [Mycoavidus cysteinexigens]
MSASAQLATLAKLREPQEPQAVVKMGFSDLQSFELMQRAAKLLSTSTIVPAAYRTVIEKFDKFGKLKETTENKNGLSNSVVALNMAIRMGVDPLMVMQNLYIVEGRPSWSSQWIIASINGCGRFSPLRFELKELGVKEVERTEACWDNGQRSTRIVKIKVTDKVCVAWAIEKDTGERIESPAVSIEMAVKEGWYTKNGSKWQTMPELMLRYRSASFFGKLYAPELLMGLQSLEEVHDIIEMNQDGSIASVSSESLRTKEIKTPDLTQPAATPETANHKTGEIHNGPPVFAESKPPPSLEKRTQAFGEHEPPSTRPGRVMSSIE